MIRNLQFSGGTQDLQHKNYLIMDPQFGLMDNLMSQMMEKLYQTINLSKGGPYTPNLTEEMTGH